MTEMHTIKTANRCCTTPVRIAIVALVTNMVLNLAFVVPMVMLEITGPHAGLALATSLAAWLNAGLLFKVLRQRQVYRPEAGWWRLFLQIVLAGSCLGGLLCWGMPVLQDWLDWSVWLRVKELVVWIIAGAGVYGIALLVSGLQFKTLWHRPH